MKHSTTQITVGDDTYDVEFCATQYYPATWDSPAEPSELELESIRLGDVEVLNTLPQTTKDRIEEILMEQLENPEIDFDPASFDSVVDAMRAARAISARYRNRFKFAA